MEIGIKLFERSSLAVAENQGLNGLNPIKLICFPQKKIQTNISKKDENLTKPGAARQAARQ